MAVPHLRNTHLGDEQEEAPLHQEAQGRALHHNRTLRDVLVALALSAAVVAEDPLCLLCCQLLHVADNGRHLVWLVSGTAQLKKSYHDVSDDAENQIQ